MRRGLAVLIAAVALAGCGSTTSSSTGAATQDSQVRAPTGGWTGFGGTLAAWEGAHPKHLAGCAAGTCYGGSVASLGEDRIEFTTVETTGPPVNRVDGLERALPDDTSAATAKAVVRALLPADTRTTSFTVVHSGAESCALWNLRSRTLGRLLGSPHVGDSHGNVGVDLYTLSSENEPRYELGHVTTASVDIAASPPGTSC